MIYQKIHYY